MGNVEWTHGERRLALATGMAPLVVCAVLALAGLFFANPFDATLLFVALVPAAYATLFAAVLPGLWLLRRTGMETLWSFSATCGLGAVLPWLGLYALCFGSPDAGKFSGATAQVAAWLCIPGVVTAIMAAAIYRQFRRQSFR